jgi:hypothetical protein
MRAFHLSLLLSAVALAIAGEARAQDASDKAMAQALFDQGLDLFDKGKTDEACNRFEQSQGLDPKLSTLVNLATCHERAGRTASAWQEFTEAASLADKQKATDRANAARVSASANAAKLSKLELTRAADTPGMTLSLDGKSLALGMLGAALPLDPGVHHLSVSAPGYVAWAHDIEIPAGPIEVPVEIPPLQKDATAPPIEPPKPIEQPKPEVKEHAPWRMPPAAIGSFAIGGATLVTGIATGAASLAMTASLKDDCKQVCGRELRGDLSTANALANASNVTFGVTAAAAIVGIVVVATSFGSSSDERKTARLVPIGDAGLGVLLPF